MPELFTVCKYPTVLVPTVVISVFKDWWAHEQYLENTADNLANEGPEEGVIRFLFVLTHLHQYCCLPCGMVPVCLFCSMLADHRNRTSLPSAMRCFIEKSVFGTESLYSNGIILAYEELNNLWMCAKEAQLAGKRKCVGKSEPLKAPQPKALLQTAMTLP